MIVEVTADVFVQMHTVSTHHVVAVARIDEQVGVSACIDASATESVSVLRYADWVVATVDNEQTAFQITRLTQE